MRWLVIAALALPAAGGCQHCGCGERLNITREAEGNVFRYQGQSGAETEVTVKLAPQHNMALCLC